MGALALKKHINTVLGAGLLGKPGEAMGAVLLSHLAIKSPLIFNNTNTIMLGLQATQQSLWARPLESTPSVSCISAQMSVRRFEGHLRSHLQHGKSEIHIFDLKPLSLPHRIFVLLVLTCMNWTCKITDPLDVWARDCSLPEADVGEPYGCSH